MNLRRRRSGTGSQLGGLESVEGAEIYLGFSVRFPEQFIDGIKIHNEIITNSLT